MAGVENLSGNGESTRHDPTNEALTERRVVSMTATPSMRERPAPWGWLTSLDLYDCNPEIIQDSDQIRRYVRQLCDLIEMRRFGDCQVVHFGEDDRVAGYSMIQFIETSLISGHFANLSNTAYIDIFSCKPYDPEKAASFSQAFFGAKHVEIHVTKRM